MLYVSMPFRSRQCATLISIVHGKTMTIIGCRIHPLKLTAIGMQYFRVAPELFTVTGNPNATNWDFEKGYNNRLDRASSMEFYPRRVLGAGYLNALSTVLRLNPDDLDYSCKVPFYGFKLYLHSPAEIPPLKDSFISVITLIETQKCHDKKLNVSTLCYRYRSNN